MSSPALAIAWSVWTRHRTGFMASAATLVAMPVIFPLLAKVTSPGAIAIAGAVPLVVVFAFVLNALLFAEDVGSMSSRYPRSMLTLPVRTRTLAFWPIVFASSGAGLLWMVTALLIYRPNGYQLPVLIPALGLAAAMAWAQALAWLPIAVFWLREVMNIVWVAALGTLAALPISLAYTDRGSFGLVAAILSVYTAAAYVVAWAAVASDRRGQVWLTWPAGATFARLANRFVQTRRHGLFRSPFQAQVWYEWRCHGLMLNGFVRVVLLAIWSVLLLRHGRGNPPWLVMIMVLLPIVVMVTIAATGPYLGRFRPFWTHVPGPVTAVTFVATRPMTTGRLVAAKLRMATVSVLLTWALAVTGTTVWIVVSDNLDNATIVARDFLNHYPGWRGFAILALACILLPALSWRLLTGPAVSVLTGRRWLADGAVWVFLAFLAGLGCCSFYLRNHPEQLARFYFVLPWLVAGVAALKAAAAVAAFRATLRPGLMSWGNIAAVLSLWLFLTICGVALAILIGPTSVIPVSWPILALGVASLVPVVRFPMATLALDWNRHR